MPTDDRNLPALALPAKSAPTNRLLGSLVLSLLGALLLLLGLNFVLSPAFLVPAAVLLRPASTKNLAPEMRRVACLILPVRDYEWARHRETPSRRSMVDGWTKLRIESRCGRARMPADDADSLLSWTAFMVSVFFFVSMSSTS